MKIKLIGNNETYAIRDIVRLFVPMQKYEFITSDDYDILVLYDEEKYFAKYKENENSYEFTLKSDKPYDKNKLKFCLFTALSKAFSQKPPWGILTGIRPSKVVRELLCQGKSKNNIKNILKNDFLVDDDKTYLAMLCAEREMKIIDEIPENSVSLYISIPFCPTRCHYCSFISQSLAYSKTLVEPYLEKLKHEIKASALLLSDFNLHIDSVYIGGGTPTTLTAYQLESLISKLYAVTDLSKIREFTVEAGRPDTIDEEKLKVMKNLGVSRISINPQTFSDKTLKIIGRSHTARDTEEKFYLARKAGFNHINTDIIAGLYGEDIFDFENTLKKISSLDPESVTVHTLCVKRGSYLAEKYDYFNTSAKQTPQMLSYAEKSLTSKGKLPYYMYRQKNMAGNLENVGFCKDKNECIYNVSIMQEVQTNLALGAGASTKLVNESKIERAFNVKEVSEYIKRTDEMIERKRRLFEENL